MFWSVFLDDSMVYDRPIPADRLIRLVGAKSARITKNRRGMNLGLIYGLDRMPAYLPTHIQLFTPEYN